MLVQKTISISKANHDNNNIRQALKILNVIIDTLKGKIDNVVEEIIGFLINEMKEGKEKKNSIIFTIVETVKSIILLYLDCNMCFIQSLTCDKNS